MNTNKRKRRDAIPDSHIASATKKSRPEAANHAIPVVAQERLCYLASPYNKVENLPLLYNALNDMKKEGQGVVHCICCLAMNIITGNACSTINCNSCQLAASKVCVYCVNGAVVRKKDNSLQDHNGEICSEQRLLAKDQKTPLPLMRECDCEENNSN